MEGMEYLVVEIVGLKSMELCIIDKKTTKNDLFQNNSR